MKNVSSLKSNDTNSPKTPGGISKSLLTPCRRLGLSRNWRKSGPSPFISPLASVSVDVEEEKSSARKRKERLSDEIVQQTDNNTESEISSENIAHTPSRNIEAPRRKKSKTLLTAINESEEQELPSKGTNEEQSIPETHGDNSYTAELEVVSTPVCTKSKKSKKHVLPSKSITNEPKINSKSEEQQASPAEIGNATEAAYKIKEKSPNDLSKECVVVIQRKMFKSNKGNHNISNSKVTKEQNPSDKYNSDSDEAPLINIQKQNSMKSNEKVIKDEDDDFLDENKTCKVKSQKITSTKNKQKSTKTVNTKSAKITAEVKPSQSCLDDDDDDDFDNKKTILIKKTYEKVSKPIKAKSTGSITQRDIDKLKERIEAKKKLLLAQSLTPDTEELRGLIKKWQKGCQDALMELLELMRNKFSDNASMDYSDMLKTLKIPPSLVGYDSENDCFISPDDENIILGRFKDI